MHNSSIARADMMRLSELTARVDSVKQDVRFTDKHLGRRIDSSELQLALTCCLT